MNEEGNICTLYKNRGPNLTACQGRFCYGKLWVGIPETGASGKIQLRGSGTGIQSEEGVEIEARVVIGALAGMEAAERKRRKERRKEERAETVG